MSKDKTFSFKAILIFHFLTRPKSGMAKMCQAQWNTPFRVKLHMLRVQSFFDLAFLLCVWCTWQLDSVGGVPLRLTIFLNLDLGIVLKVVAYDPFSRKARRLELAEEIIGFVLYCSYKWFLVSYMQKYEDKPHRQTDKPKLLWMGNTLEIGLLEIEPPQILLWQNIGILQNNLIIVLNLQVK